MATPTHLQRHIAKIDKATMRVQECYLAAREQKKTQLPTLKEYKNMESKVKDLSALLVSNYYAYYCISPNVGSQNQKITVCKVPRGSRGPSQVDIISKAVDTLLSTNEKIKGQPIIREDDLDDHKYLLKLVLNAQDALKEEVSP